MHIKVRVFPDFNEDLVVQENANTFLVYTKMPAQRGLANLAVKQLLSDFLKIDSGKLRLVRGGKQSHKIFEIVDNYGDAT